MPLSPGTRLGPYEIVAPLGAGGMGEVYRAADTTLKRQVAIKVLPQTVGADPERLARFQREAEVLAALNHPNIAHIHGLEKSDGTLALVMELVEGPTLADRIAKEPVPLDEAWPIAKQIAEALEAAHEQGIIHRDLKPANIKVRPDGTVKVLDFGLAKALDPGSGGSSASGGPAGLTASPTITSPAMTAAGMILGTAAYMSPEQARGKTVDKRADIWAFGCVLYEVLAGRPAFGGETVTDVIANVVRADPAWDALPRETPRRIRDLLRRCLQKEAAKRLRDIGDARLELDEVLRGTDAVEETRREHADGRADRVDRRTMLLASGGALMVGALIAGTITWLMFHRRVEATAAIARFTVPVPASAPLDIATLGPWASLTMSRDGRAIGYIARTAEGRQLYLRRLDELAPRPIPGTIGVWEAFFSPDGQWLGFLVADRLKKVAITGGQPILIADAPNLNAGVWADDGTIYLGGRAGLMRATADGKLTMLAKPQPNESELGNPDLLPDGSILFTIEPYDVTSLDDARIAVLTPRGERRVLLEGGSYARYSPTGHIVYGHGANIMAVPFDTQRLVVTGQPVAVTQGGMFDTFTGNAYFAFSRTGTLAYAPGGPVKHESVLVWIDRHGTSTSMQLPPRFYGELSLSPDGKQIAMSIRSANDDIWVYDIARNAFTRLTFTRGNNQVPIWSVDGSRVVYAVARSGARTLAWRAADGTGVEESLTSTPFYQTPGSFSPDGKLLAYTEDRPDTASDLFVMPMDGDRKPVAFVATPFNERDPMFSPDGRWIAYDSDETGQFEVFVAAYPGPGRRWQVSNGGGRRPRWTSGGREIVYRRGDRLMSVAVATSPSFQATPAREIVKLSDEAFDLDQLEIAPDGQRFLLVRPEGAEFATSLNVVLNWSEELKQRVPTK